ncbi:MAG: hypothetical protein J7M08_08040, partial [Planctomycetes bacterium]|nr:hypothetical protein [Planctomycetota bacterium]
DLDIFTMLGGMPRRVYGRCETVLHDIEVEDQACAMLEYDGGARGYIFVSTCEVGEGLLEIVGDRAALRVGGPELRRFKPPVEEFTRTNTEMWGAPKVEKVELKSPAAQIGAQYPGRPAPDVEEVELEPEDCESGHYVILRNFARAITDGEPLLAPGKEGMKSLELANAITLSSEKGEAVELPIDREEFDRLIERLKSTSSFKGEWGQTEAQTDPAHKT